MRVRALRSLCLHHHSASNGMLRWLTRTGHCARLLNGGLRTPIESRKNNPDGLMKQNDSEQSDAVESGEDPNRLPRC